ncbi:MAG TPA: hypothetical protein VF598_00710 [Hymenobacter sp.]
MNPGDDKQYLRIKKTVLAVVVLVLVAGVLGWWFGQSAKNDKQAAPGNNSSNVDSNTRASDSGATSSVPGVSAVINYTLPGGWQEGGCPAAPGTIYAGPGGINCTDNPQAPVRIAVDPGRTKDCNQLKPGTDGIKKHTCISQYINGRKTLKSLTEYTGSQPSVSAYYLDAGAEVVKLEYSYAGSNSFQSEFDQLSKSVTTKN